MNEKGEAQIGGDGLASRQDDHANEVSDEAEAPRIEAETSAPTFTWPQWPLMSLAIDAKKVVSLLRQQLPFQPHRREGAT